MSRRVLAAALLVSLVACSGSPGSDGGATTGGSSSSGGGGWGQATLSGSGAFPVNAAGAAPWASLPDGGVDLGAVVIVLEDINGPLPSFGICDVDAGLPAGTTRSPVNVFVFLASGSSQPISPGSFTLIPLGAPVDGGAVGTVLVGLDAGSLSATSGSLTLTEASTTFAGSFTSTLASLFDGGPANTLSGTFSAPFCPAVRPTGL